MMIKFKDFLTTHSYNQPIEFPSAKIAFKEHELSFRFDSKDTVLEAGYTGPANLWLSSLCYLSLGKNLNELSEYSLKSWELIFKNDQFFWDFRRESGDSFFHSSLEMLKGLLDIFRGKEYLYEEASPLICRCFGVRENDVLSHLNTTDSPSLETLATATKAGMGCRSCVPQLKRWLVLSESKKKNRYYKDRPVVDWLVQIDYQLSRFPKTLEWKMELAGMKNAQVSILFEKESSQKEEELVARELQDFLAAGVDTGLAFFLLRRDRHFSKAKG